MRTLLSLRAFLFVSSITAIAGCGVRTGVQVRGEGTDGGVPSDGRVPDMGRDAPWDGGACSADLQCDDGLFCDGIERCISGHCQRGVPTDCNDGIDCTTDQCVEGGGCVSRVNDALCPPGDRCTAAGCVPRTTGCMSDVDCDDHAQCNGIERCDVATATCFATPPMDCSDGVSCTDDQCVEGFGCAHAANSFECPAGQTCDVRAGCISRMCNSPTDCDDHEPCNGIESCGADGLCRRGTQMNCNDGNACTIDFCQIGIGCISQPAQEQCGDGVDNDCNGLIDCRDPFCVTVPMCRGCVPTSTFESSCFDGVDNDCNGAIDCGDPVCVGQPSCTMCVPIAPIEVQCFDGRDDDCDGAFDCDDVDCRARGECNFDGGFVPDAWVCRPTAPIETQCNNGIDEDCDFLVDCNDPDCGGSTFCRFRDAGPVCTFPELCHNGIDDDCNGAADCMDPFCVMTDPSCRPVCMPTSMFERRCFDGIDDDCDGRIDCADPDCRARPGCVDGGFIRDGGLDSSGPLFDAGSVSNEIGVAACTNGIDDDHDGRADCLDPDCRPFGPMGECCNGIDDTGDGNVDEFTCRCFDQSFCGGVGSLDQVCWTSSYSVCAPRCNFYGGNAFCQMYLPTMPTCNAATGECQ